MERVLALSQAEAQRASQTNTAPSPPETETSSKGGAQAVGPHASEPGKAHARKRFFGKPLRTLLVSDKTSRMPGLGRRVRLQPLHPHRRPPPPKRPRLPTKDAPPPKEGSDAEEEENGEPEPDYENEGFL